VLLLCRESARVRRAKRKESTQHLTQENDDLRHAIRKLQHTLATLNPSLPATAFYYRYPNALSAGSSAAAAHAAAAAANPLASRGKRVNGEKMTVEELKQARRCASVLTDT
jgi:homoserine kinase